MYKAFRNSAIALTLIGGVGLFAAPVSADPITKHQIFLGDSSKPLGLTDVGWRRHYRYWGPPPYYWYGPYAYGPAYYGPGLSYYPGPAFAVGIY